MEEETTRRDEKENPNKKEKKKSKNLYGKWVKIPVVLLHLFCAGVLLLTVVAMLVGELTFSDFLALSGRSDGNREQYLQSKIYTGLVFRQMQGAIRLHYLETILETDGKLDLNKEILKIKETDGSIKTYTLGDIIQAEVGGGFEIMPEYRDYSWDYSWNEATIIREDITMGTGHPNGTAVIESESVEEGVSDWSDDSFDTSDIDTAIPNDNTSGRRNESVNVLWFACDTRYSPIYQEPEGGIADAKTMNWGKHQIGWAALDCVEWYQSLKRELQEKEHNFYYAFTGSTKASNGKTPEEILALGNWYRIKKLPGQYEEEGNLELFGEEGYNPYYGKKLDTTGYYQLRQEGDELIIGVDTTFSKKDAYTAQMDSLKKQHRQTLLLLLLFILAIPCFILTLLYLIRAAGRTSRSRMLFFDRIPFEFLIAAGVLLLMAERTILRHAPWYVRELTSWISVTYGSAGTNGEEVSASYDFLERFFDTCSQGEVALLYGTGICFVNYLFLLVVSLRLLRHRRHHSSHSFILQGGRLLYQVSKENIALSWQTGLTVLAGAGLLTGLAVLTGILAVKGESIAFLSGTGLLLLLGALLVFLIKKAQEKDALLRETAQLAEGELEGELAGQQGGENKAVQTKAAAVYTGADKKLAEHIGHIREGMAKAVEQAMKNERMKTELITNVSHDIKTPLTSIINYVDLLKRELIGEENRKNTEAAMISDEESEASRKRTFQYLEVLDQKSKRLKTLTEDLVEASKASSGVLTITPEKINLAELTSQVNGEFEEKFADRGLKLIASLPEQPVFILAEGRRVYRILENLYQNAFKYAMEGSRIYVETGILSAETDNLQQHQAVFTIKNISAEPLSVSAEELTERFVRGDLARSSEGSGLGLSIARSLTELQKGTFELSIDGDLFRVRLSFPEWTDGVIW